MHTLATSDIIFIDLQKITHKTFQNSKKPTQKPIQKIIHSKSRSTTLKIFTLIKAKSNLNKNNKHLYINKLLEVYLAVKKEVLFLICIEMI